MARSRRRLNRLAAAGDLEGARAWLARLARRVPLAINAYDAGGYTPLLCAVSSEAASIELVSLLLAHGARVGLHTLDQHGHHEAHTPLSLAIRRRNLGLVRLLLDAGADVRATRPHGYDAVIDACFGELEPVTPLLELLIAAGASVTGESSYHETAIGVLSRLADFEAVALLINAGADERLLEFTKLMHAVAFGSNEQFTQALASTPREQLEAVDGWQRTALLLALRLGSLHTCQALVAAGASWSAVGRGDKPALFFAIESGNVELVAWVLEQGASVDATDDFHGTALMLAASLDSLDLVRLLLAKGADVAAINNGASALTHASTRPVISCLLEAGADPALLSKEGRRVLAYLPPHDCEPALATVTKDDFVRARTRRFGTANPEQVTEPFWLAMIQAGVGAWHASKVFENGKRRSRAPVWCAERFGQSLTRLPDGRVVQIGGEHEDSYDVDFCIYNDVFVHSPHGELTLFAYPADVFPPTDFHTATVMGDELIVVGSLGYAEDRQPNETPVFRFNTTTFRCERVRTSGPNPGWLSAHRAVAISPTRLAITGGRRSSPTELVENTDSFVLDLATGRWSRGDD